jgi:hypothetical protein
MKDYYFRAAMGLAFGGPALIGILLLYWDETDRKHEAMHARVEATLARDAGLEPEIDRAMRILSEEPPDSNSEQAKAARRYLDKLDESFNGGYPSPGKQIELEHEQTVLAAEKQMATGRDPRLYEATTNAWKRYATSAYPYNPPPPPTPIVGDVPPWQERERDSVLPPCKKACVYGESWETEAAEARATCAKQGDSSAACKAAFVDLFDKQDACWDRCQALERTGAR